MTTKIESPFTVGELYYIIISDFLTEPCSECGHEKETKIKRYFVVTGKLTAIRVSSPAFLAEPKIEIGYYFGTSAIPVPESCIFSLSDERAAKKKCGRLKNAESQYHRKAERERKAKYGEAKKS